MRRLMMGWFGLIFWLMMLPVLAQGVEQPLIAYFNEQLHRYDGTQLVPWDGCDTGGEPPTGEFSAAPDSSLMYMGTLPVRVQQIIDEQGGIGGGPLPTNIWVCDRVSGSATPVATQPDDFSFFNSDQPDVFTIRSSAVWSPDGTRLAWAEGNFTGDEYTLIIHNTQTGETLSRVLTEVPQPDIGIPSPPMVLWGGDFIVIPSGNFDIDTGQQIETITVYSDTGEFLAQNAYFESGENTPFVADRHMALSDDGVRMLVQFDDGRWGAVEPMTGVFNYINAQPQIISASATDAGAIRMAFETPFNADWEMLTANDSSGVYEGYPPGRVAIAPEGNGFAVADSMLRIWRAGDAMRPISGSDGFADDFGARLIWAGYYWRIGGTPLPPDQPLEMTPESCPNTQPSRLYEGMMARVVPGTAANNLRESPTINAARIGSIPAGGELLVIAGPVCADGYAWFNVQYDDLTGWTAEGSTSQYWLEELPPR